MGIYNRKDSQKDAPVHFLSNAIREWELKHKTQFTLDVEEEDSAGNVNIKRYPIQHYFIREIETRVAKGYKWTRINGSLKKRSELLNYLQKIYGHLVYKKMSLDGVGTDDDEL